MQLERLSVTHEVPSSYGDGAAALVSAAARQPRVTARHLSLGRPPLFSPLPQLPSCCKGNAARAWGGGGFLSLKVNFLLLIGADPSEGGNVTCSHNSAAASERATFSIVSLAVNFRALPGHSLILNSDREGARNALLLGRTAAHLTIKQKKELIWDAPGEALDPFGPLPKRTAS